MHFISPSLALLQNAYDMAELQKSLQPSPAQSVQYSRSRAIHHHPPSQQQQQHFCQPDPPSRVGTATTTSSISSGTATIRRDVPPCRSPAQGQTANPSRAAQLARKSLSFSSQDLARYLCEIIRDADQHPEDGTFRLAAGLLYWGGRLAGRVTEFLQLCWAGRGNGGRSRVFERVGAALREAESPLRAGRGQRPLRNCREEFLQGEERRETTKD